VCTNGFYISIARPAEETVGGGEWRGEEGREKEKSELRLFKRTIGRWPFPSLAPSDIQPHYWLPLRALVNANFFNNQPGIYFILILCFAPKQPAH
jgi:hypothetical protein